MSIFRGCFRAHQTNYVVIAMCVSGPNFGSVDSISITFRRCRCTNRGKVGARIWLAHADGEVALTPGNTGQILRPLFFGTESQQERATLTVCNPVGADRCARRQQFLGDHQTFKVGFIGTAHLGRPRHSNPTLLTQFL